MLNTIDTDQWNPQKSNSNNLPSSASSLLDVFGDQSREFFQKNTEFFTEKILKDISLYVDQNLPYSQWAEWEIYKVPVVIDEKITYFIVAKKRFDRVIEHEYTCHSHAQEILNTSSIHQYISVPSLYTKDNNGKLIIMEFIQGKTLYTLVIEAIIKKINKTPINCLSDGDAEHQLLKILSKHNKNTTPTDIPAFVAQEAKNNIKIFSQKEWTKRRSYADQAIQIFHKNGLYHKDIGNWSNLRNIMFWEDGKMYIIDFWRSMIIDPTHPVDEKEIYGTTINNTYKAKDENDKNLLYIISSLTKNDEDVAMEKETQEHTKKFDTISSESSLIDIFVQKDILDKVIAPFGVNKKEILSFLKKIPDASSLDHKLLRHFDIKKILPPKKYIAHLLQQSPTNVSDFLKRCEFVHDALSQELRKVTQELQTNTQALLSWKMYFQWKEITFSSEKLKEFIYVLKIQKEKIEKQIDYINNLVVFTNSINDYLKL